MYKISRILLGLLCAVMHSSSIRPSQDAATCQEIARCLNKEFKLYGPSPDIQKKLNELFQPDFFETLEQQAEPTAWLERQGFKPLQFKKDLPFMAVIVQNKQLPDHVIKFMRITAPIKRVKKSRYPERNEIRSVPKISNRVVNAKEVKKIIKNLNLRSVNVPDKYFYCVNNIALVIEKKIVPSGRTLKDLNNKEISEILKLVAATKGILDLRPRNMLLTDDTIFFIDTERERYADWWPNTKLKDLARFKDAIAPQYQSLVDTWAAQQDKRYKKHRVIKKTNICQ